MWRQALHDPHPFHDYEMRHRVQSDRLVRLQQNQRRAMLQINFEIRPLTAMTAAPLPEAPEWYRAAWPGKPVEMWRVECRDLYWHQLKVIGGRAVLSGEDSTFADWIGLRT
ncbi:hypothetical protein [Micromonospora humi]|uniref:Uncharacterized protein n=1 Tax=Micromonospora humi TaxID=745366 RepID=A0A1C5IQW6_9ACTN|nr:hypothetical protein [Micromonospora humi]SCG60553.1 hypothetical protein GA0070213_106358 [Micromonospora humi]